MATNPLWAARPEDLDTLPRNAVHGMVDKLIDWLDQRDGDPDLEETGIEDGFVDMPGEGAGCYIADTGEDDDPAEDDDEDRGDCEAEPDFRARRDKDAGPGCEISDAGEDNHDREGVEEAI